MAESSIRSESNPLMMSTPTHQNSSVVSSSAPAIQLPPSPGQQNPTQQSQDPSPANYLPTGQYNPKHHYVFKPIDENNSNTSSNTDITNPSSTNTNTNENANNSN